MKKIIKTFFGMELMTVLMLFFAFSCAVATFVENDYGPLGAKSFIYGQTWFETIMLLLTIGVIFNIFWFKMYKKEKFLILMIHISFIFIFLGSALTRYVGYEATMTISEGQTQNKIYTLDDFVQIELKQNDKKQKFEQKVLMTKLNQTDFSHNFSTNKDLIEVKFNSFVPNAAEKIVDVEDGIPMVNIIVSTLNGMKSIDLKKEDVKETMFLAFSLNKEIKESKKPVVSFITKDKNIYYKSNIKTSWYSIEDKLEGEIKANNEQIVYPARVYKVGQTEFMIKEASVSGALKVVSLLQSQIKKENQVDAVLVDVIYKNKTKQVALFKAVGATRGYVNRVKLDENVEVKMQWGSKEITLPFGLKLLDFSLERYPGSNSPSSYLSDIEIVDKELKDEKFYRIYMNNTLDYAGFRFFQSSYKTDETGTILSVNKDPGKVPTYIGYFLLFTGLFMNLFSKNGRFRKLSSKKHTLESVKKSYYLKNNLAILLATLFIFFQTSSFANDEALKSVQNIDKNHAKYFGSVLIQDYQGRIKPINSLAIEIINKLTRKNEIFSLDANQFFLSMMVYPNIWQEIEFIKVNDDKLKKILGIQKDTISFKNIYDDQGNYKLTKFLENTNAKKPALRTKFDKELIKVDERLNIAYTLFMGDFFKAFPIKYDEKNRWIESSIAIRVLENSSDIDLPKQEALEIKKLMKDYYFALNEATKDPLLWENATNKLKEIQKYQEKFASHIMPSNWKIKAELIFNKYNIFERLTPFYLILGFILLITIFINIFKQNLNLSKFTKVILVLFAIGFIFHTFGLALRWYVAGHAPWSNGYESMIYIAWAIVLSGMFFSKQSNLALATTGILSGITLFVAHLSWMEPQITTLAPVLKSYWLTIHVSVITASYGFLGLSALLGFISIVLFTLLNKKVQDDKFFSILLSIKEANRINEMSILIGLVLLVIGNFLGGIWANESWGRYWGWDPKETWTLVSILIYATIIHLKYIKDILSDYLFALLSLISYASIIMTYFGVNYYLSGKHSYAAGDPVPIPTFVPVTAIVVLILIFLSYRNRKVL